MKKLLIVLLCAVWALGLDLNRWVPTSGGKFGTAANWSLGHAPAVTDSLLFDTTAVPCTITVKDTVGAIKMAATYTGWWYWYPTVGDTIFVDGSIYLYGTNGSQQIYPTLKFVQPNNTNFFAGGRTAITDAGFTLDKRGTDTITVAAAGSGGPTIGNLVCAYPNQETFVNIADLCYIVKLVLKGGTLKIKERVGVRGTNATPFITTAGSRIAAYQNSGTIHFTNLLQGDNQIMAGVICDSMYNDAFLIYGDYGYHQKVYMRVGDSIIINNGGGFGLISSKTSYRHAFYLRDVKLRAAHLKLQGDTVSCYLGTSNITVDSINVNQYNNKYYIYLDTATVNLGTSWKNTAKVKVTATGQSVINFTGNTGGLYTPYNQHLRTAKIVKTSGVVVCSLATGGSADTLVVDSLLSIESGFFKTKKVPVRTAYLSVTSTDSTRIDSSLVVTSQILIGANTAINLSGANLDIDSISIKSSTGSQVSLNLPSNTRLKNNTLKNISFVNAEICTSCVDSGGNANVTFWEPAPTITAQPVRGVLDSFKGGIKAAWRGVRRAWR